MTRAHEDRITDSDGLSVYAIKVGDKLPDQAVNLAYVHSPEMSPESNLHIADFTNRIPENTQGENNTIERLVYPDQDFVLRDLGGNYKLPSRHISLTDEFSIPSNTQEKPSPLYYMAEVKGLFDAKGTSVIEYIGGYHESPVLNPKNYNSIAHTQPNDLLYLGSKIKITNLDGTPLAEGKKYKIKLIRQDGENVPSNAYRIAIYTNFVGTKDETYLVRYEKYGSNGTHKADYTEVLNAYSFFTEVEKDQLTSLSESPKENGEWKIDLKNKEYAIEETEDGEFVLYAPSQVIVGDSTTRPSHEFEYRITGKLKTKFSSGNHGKAKIGVAYFNQSAFGVEDLTGVVKKINESSAKAPYLTLENPHPSEGYAGLKEDPRYWIVDLSMPESYLGDYDLIIITGYGSYDASYYSDALRSYLENGGRVWIDNAGSGTNAFKLNNLFLNIGFSQSNQETGFKTLGSGELNNEFLDRLYHIGSENLTIGYEGINPEITFGSGESLDSWDVLIRYSTNKPSIIYKKMFEKGLVIVSNCGIMKAISNNESSDIRMMMNILLNSAEEKWISSPWRNNYVFHRDNLFKQEYQVGEEVLYFDGQNDLDPTQIVAKKLLKKTVREAMLPYMDPAYYQAKGTFSIEVKSDNNIFVANHDFEVGHYDESIDDFVDSWISTTQNAIPGWSAVLPNGSGEFNHVSSTSQRGEKALKVTGVGVSGGQTYWRQTINQLSAGSYKVATWIKTEGVVANTAAGATIAVFNKDTGEKISSSAPVTETRSWFKIELNFGLVNLSNVEIRLGFTDGRCLGSAYFDYVELKSIGSVYMTPENDGSKPLYAYTIRPKNNSLDLSSQGFDYADVTIYDPSIRTSLTIKSFVYAWNNQLQRYVKRYGNEKKSIVDVRRSDGNLSIGLVTTLLPELKSGSDWADRNKVFFEIITDNRLVNVGFFNRKTGSYYYNKIGENVIGWSSIYSTNTNSQNHIVAQVWTNYYTVRATKRRYSIKINPSSQIYLQYPATIDERDNWHLRVHNGEFTKRRFDHDKTAVYLDEFGTKHSYNQMLHDYYKYALPEYDRQLFKPGKPWRKVKEEICEYVDDRTIRLQNYPLYIQQGKIQQEDMTRLSDDQYQDGSSRFFQSAHKDWVKRVSPKIYVDYGNTGAYTEILSGYDIDYQNGMVIFEEGLAATDNVRVDYEYSNLQIMKRKYKSKSIKQEKLKYIDGKTFNAKNIHWLVYPSPSIYFLPYGSNTPSIVPVEMYEVDYENGTITFYEEVADQVLADYTYSTVEPLLVRDYDTQNGIIYLENEITFKDEVFANYYYEEKFVEYKGYYDSEAKAFMSLDLNPAEGHYCTIPYVYNDANTGNKIVKYERKPTAQLMNKEIYIYLLPYRDSQGNVEKNPLRHCLTKTEWEKIKAVTPTAILLGIAYIREHTQIDNVTVLDSRKRGGGLKETIKNKSIASNSYWDIGSFDGQAYYSNGVLILELPKTILTREGGQFTEKEVNDIVKKYIAFGIYYVIEYV